ncbi:hypothetical protein HanHA300_Chr01g0001391 [Helianthus annuus]|nr:hypothetical protein HanHA300_Chr01g0001391 [Helianthus annuus]KAJ0625425.1 hypothetical protein HanHA89_Chr01g0001481 [Helianthus annuus]KAJ0781845.1 hypothetical protein HanLR1_Chr01g0001401 [Helianthus annuus]KAJ0955323.1 hypothetical protein HanPSC8_Chr01g0001531 [Helianthus annuus]
MIGEIKETSYSWIQNSRGVQNYSYPKIRSEISDIRIRNIRKIGYPKFRISEFFGFG